MLLVGIAIKLALDSDSIPHNPSPEKYMIVKTRKNRLARLASLLDRPDILEELAQRVTDGAGLVEICDAWKVPYGRFAEWLGADPKRMQVYENALKIRADALISEAVKVSHETQLGISTKTGPDGKVITEEDMLGHRKLLIDTHFKAAARWDRERFGDSERVELTARMIKPDEVTLLEGARRIAFAMARGAHLAEQKRREPRLLEGKVIKEDL